MDASGATGAQADEIGRRVGARVTLLDAQDVPVGDSALGVAALARMGTLRDRPEVIAARLNPIGEASRREPGAGRPTLYIAIRIDPEEESSGVIRLSASLEPVQAARRAVRPPLYLTAFVVLPAAALLGRLTARRLARRLVGLSRAASRIGGGRTDVRAPAGGADETALLARSLNRMSEAIDERARLLTRERNLLRTVLSAMVEGVLLTDVGGTILLANEAFAKIFRTDGPLEGRRPLEVARVPALQQAIDAALGAAAPIQREIALGAGEDRVVRASLSPVREGSLIVGAVAVFHDVTEIKRLEKVRREFVANVSHELRTPLTAIKGYAETLRDGGLSDPRMAAESVDVIHRHAERLRALIEDLLDLSAIEQGMAALKIGAVPIAEVVAQATAVIDPAARAGNLRLNVEIPDDLPRARADRDRLAQVLINLLDNAVKFTREGGRIDVMAGREEGSVVIAVRDTGIGIPGSEVERIFERFHKVDRSRDRKNGGTGLGLAIARHLVQAMGGSIRVESVEGEGTTFHVRLPIA